MTPDANTNFHEILTDPLHPVFQLELHLLMNLSSPLHFSATTTLHQLCYY